MKKALLTLAVVGVAAAAFSQGKVSLQIDGGSAITLGLNWWNYMPADVALAGQQVPTTGPLPSGHILEVGLYAGTSSTALSLTSTTLLNPVGGTGNASGIIPIVHIILPFAGGTLAYYQVRIWSSTYASYEAMATAVAGGAVAYGGENNLFTMTAGTSITYPAINSGGNTTWAAVGNESFSGWNLIAYWLPEPTSFALVGLGATMLFLRAANKGGGEREERRVKELARQSSNETRI